MSGKKFTPKKEVQEVKRADIDLKQIIEWSKKYVSPFELPKLVNELNKQGSLKESYPVTVFFTGLQILSLIFGYLLVYLITGPNLISSDLISVGLQLVISAIVGILLFYITSWLIYIISKIVGGTVDFGNQTYVLSVLNLIHRSIFFVFLIFSYPSMAGALPVLFGGVIVLVLFVVSLYLWYAQFQVIKQLNNFSLWKALFVLLVYLFANSLLLVVISYLLIGDYALA